MSEWIKHDGDECPVHPKTMVQYRMREELGLESRPTRADDIDWEQSSESWCITHYRLADAQSNQQVSAQSFLDAAGKHMDDRAAAYDEPSGERSIAKVVGIFNLFHGTELTETQGWHFMQIVKDVRFFTANGFHRDSAEDAIAYAALKAEAKQGESNG